MATIASSNANGASVSYTYDSLNRLSTVVDNRLAGEAPPPTPMIRPATWPRSPIPTACSPSFTYDKLNRVTGLATQASGYTYQLGPTGNRTSASEPNGRSVTWNYDGIYRLTNEAISSDPNHENGSVSYSLDPVGNRLSDTSSLTGVNSGSFGLQR